MKTSLYLFLLLFVTLSFAQDKSLDLNMAVTGYDADSKSWKLFGEFLAEVSR